MLGPPRDTGKTTAVLVPTVLTAYAPVVAASTKDDVFAATALARALLGRVWHFAPDGTEPTPAGARQLRWSPVTAAADWDMAVTTAEVMVSVANATLGGHSADGGFWSIQAGGLLAPLLHAAAISGSDMRRVMRWVMLRARIEPWVPVVGTVPAIKPAAARGGQVAVWATVATSGSAYQRRLIREFGRGARVEPIACPGLADAIDAGDDVGIEQAVWAAAAKTPAGTTDVVLGCTEYELIPDRIAAALDGHVTLHASAPAIAAQVMRRSRQVSAQGHRRLHVLLSGLSGCLPEVARRYRPGQVLLASSPSEIGA